MRPYWAGLSRDTAAVPPVGMGIKLVVTTPAAGSGPVLAISPIAPGVPLGRGPVSRITLGWLDGIGTSNSANVGCGSANGAASLPGAGSPSRGTPGYPSGKPE